VTDEWAQRLGNSVPDWPAFPDSADALARLAKHYQLIILSNVHRDGFAAATGGCAVSSPPSSPPRTWAPTSPPRTTFVPSTGTLTDLGLAHRDLPEHHQNHGLVPTGTDASVPRGPATCHLSFVSSPDTPTNS
jgi:hypothetical protein